MLRFVAYLIICALTIAALRAGGPPILCAAVSAAAIFLVVVGARPPRGRRPVRAPRQRSVFTRGELRRIKRYREQIAAAREAATAEAIREDERNLNDPAWLRANDMHATAELVEARYAAKGIRLQSPTPPAVPTWSATKTEACGCRRHSSGHAHADTGDRVWEAHDPCPEHRQQQEEAAHAVQEIDNMIEFLRKDLDEALGRTDGQRWMGAR